VVKAFIRRAIADDAYYLAPRLRSADLQEIKAGSGCDPLAMLLDGIKKSDRCFAVIAPDVEPVAVFGVVPFPDKPGVGIPWMLGSDKLLDFRKQLLREGRTHLARLARHYTMLVNSVDKRNTVHIRWLRWMGVTFVGESILGPQRLPFLDFIYV
jgi:hypothetical protein